MYVLVSNQYQYTLVIPYPAYISLLYMCKIYINHVSANYTKLYFH